MAKLQISLLAKDFTDMYLKTDGCLYCSYQEIKFFRKIFFIFL